ncbi:MAG: glycoside hydrolase family 5 protein [Tunicatimonas sp.]
MKTFVASLTLSLLTLHLSPCAAQPTPAADTTFAVRRGTNIAHWLSQSQRRGEERRAFFQEEDVAYLAELGFDHLRIPVDEEQLFDEDGRVEREAMDLLHDAIGWCQNHNLRVVVDLHILRSHHFNHTEKPLWTESAAQERFFGLWRSLSAELQQYPTAQVAYELMNEPVADDPDDWNRLVARAVAVIREKEPTRTIVIGSNRWQSADTFDELEIPANDRHILLSFHFYEPFLLTHYRASWTDIGDYAGPVHYPGHLVRPEELAQMPDSVAQRMQSRVKEFSPQKLAQMMEKPLRVARAHNLPLYCGEWGAMATAPEADRLRWYQDMVELFEKHDIAYANWNYRSDNFGLVNGQKEQQALIEVVTSGMSSRNDTDRKQGERLDTGH